MAEVIGSGRALDWASGFPSPEAWPRFRGHGPLAVDGAAVGKRHQIGHGRAAVGVVAFGTAPDFEEDVGDEFLGFAAVAEHALAEGVDETAVPVVDRGEGVRVLVSDASHEFVIVGGAWHCWGGW